MTKAKSVGITLLLWFVMGAQQATPTIPEPYRLAATIAIGAAASWVTKKASESHPETGQKLNQ
jgi:hypothetical protein